MPEAEIRAGGYTVPPVGVCTVGGLDVVVSRCGGLLRVTAPCELLGTADRPIGAGTGLRGDVRVVCDSTSTILAEAASRDPGLPAGTFVVAETQTGGRGRWGRRWSSPPFVGLWFSLWLPRRNGLPAGRAAAAAAVGVARCVEAAGAKDIWLLWPNDIVAGSRKVGGMLLVECAGGWVLGVGLNLQGDPVRFVDNVQAEEPGGAVVARPPASLAWAGACVAGRAALLEELAGGILQALDEAGGHALSEEWRARQHVMGRRVCLRMTRHVAVGTVRDVHPEHGLVLAGKAGWVMPQDVWRLEELGGA